MIFRLPLLCFLAVITFMSPVFAVDNTPEVNDMVLLDETKATHFVDSLDDLKLIREQRGDKGRKDPFRIQRVALMEQNFAPYRSAVKKLKEEDPDDYARLKELAEKHHFESAEDWAETADGVMLTFYYIQQETEGRTVEDKMREQLRPDMLAKVPASQRCLIDNALKMAHKINEVPEENERIVRGLLPRLQVAVSQNL